MSVLRIGIAGKIASGKSTVGKALAKEFSCSLVSFGGILRKYSQVHDLPTDRESLQTLGQNLIDALGEERFMDWTIAHSLDIDWKHPLVLEGFRHVGSYKQFVRLYPSALLVYCQVDREVQIQRLNQRDGLTKEKALSIKEKVSSQKIKRGSLKQVWVKNFCLSPAYYKIILQLVWIS